MIKSHNTELWKIPTWPDIYLEFTNENVQTICMY